MAKIKDKGSLLSRINKEIKNGATTITDLSAELKQDIEDTVDPIIVNQGLRAVHSFLLQFLSSAFREIFKWPAQAGGQ